MGDNVTYRLTVTPHPLPPQKNKTQNDSEPKKHQSFQATPPI